MSVLDAYIVDLVIQRFREQRGQSQELLSGLAGIGRTHLSAIERGQRKPTLETFWRISEALGLKPSVLMAAIEEEMQKNCPAPSGAGLWFYSAENSSLPTMHRGHSKSSGMSSHLVPGAMPPSG